MCNPLLYPIFEMERCFSDEHVLHFSMREISMYFLLCIC